MSGMARAPGSTAGHAASAHKRISERPSPPLQQALTERAVLCYIKAERSGRAAARRKRGWMTMFRGARRADLDAILKIYARARQAMADSGNPTQWGEHFPPQELLEEDIDSNRLFLYLVNGELEGVFAFILGPDPTYARIEDGKWLNDTLPYGTIHRLASAGRHPGVAAAVITWCLEHCESLRADTHADNKIMQHLLEENGFTKCGIIHVEDGTPRIAYQKMSLTLPLRRD